MCPGEHTHTERERHTLKHILNKHTSLYVIYKIYYLPIHTIHTRIHIRILYRYLKTELESKEEEKKRYVRAAAIYNNFTVLRHFKCKNIQIFAYSIEYT